MSDIDSFMNFKLLCPLCAGDLHLHFISNNSKRISVLEGKFRASLTINGFPSPASKKKFDVHLFIDLKTNEFSMKAIDPNKEDSYLEMTTVQKSDCKSFFTNKAVQIYKQCTDCTDYHYASNQLSFNYNNLKIDDFSVRAEYAKINRKTDQEIRRYELTNNYHTKKSILLYDNSEMGTGVKPTNMMELPLIKFIDKNSLLERLDTILVFS